MAGQRRTAFGRFVAVRAGSIRGGGMSHWRSWAWLAALPALVSWWSDYGGTCVGPPPPPTEISLGLVAGDFANNGPASVVATSTVLTNPQVNPGNLKVYLATGGGAFAAPTLVSDGNDPLYLASADLNGDKLPDIVSASFSDAALAVFFNSTQSPGTFSAPLILPSPGASQVAIGD